MMMPAMAEPDKPDGGARGGGGGDGRGGDGGGVEGAGLIDEVDTHLLHSVYKSTASTVCVNNVSV